MSIQRKTYDAIVIGGGHNGLVSACYLSKMKKRVLILESNATLGGATASAKIFPSYEANLSRYSYLVSLLPDQIVKDLGLRFKTLDRSVSSYTPCVIDGEHKGLYVAKHWDARTEESFRCVTGSKKEGANWQSFYAEISQLAERLAPTLLQPLQSAAKLQSQVDLADIWHQIIQRPIGQTIQERFHHDVVRGIVMTDALIGTFADDNDHHANACFLYHVIGNGTGQWRVPLGGMGALVHELTRVAQQNDVAIETNAKVTDIEIGTNGVSVRTEKDSRFTARDLIFAGAPQQLQGLLGMEPTESLPGSQIKINMLVNKLPQLKSGMDPHLAFAGTLHINESFTQLQSAFQTASRGQIPKPMPLEIYCHTLADSSILSEELAQRGFHTLTLFGLHTPHDLFEYNHELTKQTAAQLAIDSLNSHLAEPIESVLAPCVNNTHAIEIVTPVDLEAEIGLPRGNIFHNQLSFPFLREEETESDVTRWGAETEYPHVFIGGAGSRRGGGVSGIAGHNAAMAILNQA
ncbi:MAG: NAD(P)/FAD-dependent oxidoreductase [Rubripirellula sp.]|nr:NAD(P)/FAD-dependent oxidoreductase [Rubripirellula sp.]